jgi:hypothetical protein
MAEQITTTYDGIEITYNEIADTWHFELRGRDRSARTLAKAKEAIDKPDPKEKTFKPVDVYYGGGYDGGRYVTARVTSVADAPHGREEYLWCTKLPNGSRSKESSSRFFKINEKNKLLVAAIDQHYEQVKELREKIEALSRQMEPAFKKGEDI